MAGGTAPAVSAEHRDGISTVWLDRPQAGNALGAEMVAALDEAVDAALAAGARMLVLRARGRNFCTGLDLSRLETQSDGDLALHIIRIELLLQKVHGLPITTVALASGRTLGAGADLFTACDHRIALAGASFAFPGSAFGLVLGTRRLAQRVGNAAARRLLLAGGVADADTAGRIGLATRVAELGDAEGWLAEVAGAASRLDAATVAALHGRTQDADDDGDLAALARSMARPGLGQRIANYRAQASAARPGS